MNNILKTSLFTLIATCVFNSLHCSSEQRFVTAYFKPLRGGMRSEDVAVNSTNNDLYRIAFEAQDDLNAIPLEEMNLIYKSSIIPKNDDPSNIEDILKKEGHIIIAKRASAKRSEEERFKQQVADIARYIGEAATTLRTKESKEEVLFILAELQEFILARNLELLA